MKHVIASFAKIPEDRLAFFHSHIANNSTMSLGSKIKLVLAIASSLGVPVDKEAFHVLLSRRNAFAHQDPVGSIRLTENGKGETDISFVVESIKSNGGMETVTRDEAYEQFMRAHTTIEQGISALQKAIYASNELSPK